MQYDIEDHPDLKDAAWLRAANRRAKRDIRRQRRQARMHQHGRTVVVAIALVAVGAVLFGLYRAGTFDRVSLPQVTLPTDVAPYQGVNVEKPFAGTPAEQWADGEKGIVAPDANPAFEQVRQALIAAHTDPAMISEHKPDRFLALLVPAAREKVSTEISVWTIRLKQGTKLLPNGIRAAGTMTLGEKGGYPAVTADYVFAYAFEPPDPKKLADQMEMVAAVRQKVTYAITPEGLLPWGSEGFRYSIACQASKEGFLGPQFIEPPKNGVGVNDDKRYFTVDGAVPTEDTCH